MNKKDKVIRAIEFKNPDKIPIWAFNKDQEDGDILSYELFPFHEGEIEKSDWGYTWTNLGDGTIGQPKDPVIPGWSSLKSYSFPDTESDERFKGIMDFKAKSDYHFLIAEMGISGFNTYLFLRGFINSMIDFQARDKRALDLLDSIMEIETRVAEKAAGYGFDAIHFADDHGNQKASMVSPQLWVEIFKPRFKRQFKSIHDLGLKIFFHSCGNVTSLVPEFHDIGLDVMNISQPNVVDIDKISDSFRGKQCFLIPISYQTVSISGSPENITEEAKRLFSKLGTKHGGFIGYIEEYSVMGMPEKNYKACWDAFKGL